MKEFKVLPTDERFKSLTNWQIEWIWASMERDAVEAERIRKGKNPNMEYEDFDDSWLNEDHENWNPVRDDHDEANIAKQVKNITSDEDMARLKARWEKMEEAESEYKEAGSTIEEDSINDYISNRIKEVQEEAKRVEKHLGNDPDSNELQEKHKNSDYQPKLQKGDISKAINLFEGTATTDESGDELPSQDDDFEI